MRHMARGRVTLRCQACGFDPCACGAESYGPDDVGALIARLTVALYDAIADDAHAVTCTAQGGPGDDADLYQSEWDAIVAGAQALGVTLPASVAIVGDHSVPDIGETVRALA